jgi:twitching motility protein PilT
MDLDALIQTAATNGASDLHLEAGLPAAIRIRGTLRTIGEPLPARPLLDTARR